MNFKITPMVSTALKPYSIIREPGETVLIIGDSMTDPGIFESFTCAAKILDLEPIVIVMQPLERDFSDPPVLVQEAAKSADILHYVTTTGLVHSKFGRSISKMGKKKIVSEGITCRMLLEGAALADINMVSEFSKRVAEIWNAGSDVHITSELGSDLRLSIEDRRTYAAGFFPVFDAGFEIGSASTVQFPGGEVGVAPVEDTAEGILVIDKNMHFPHGILNNPITLRIRQGTITEIEGAHEAQQFKDWLESFGDKNGYRLCELSVGVNNKACWMGSPRQDRFVLGSSHVGFGINADVGGTIESNIHYDGVLSCPNIKVDNKIFVQNGRFSI